MSSENTPASASAAPPSIPNPKSKIQNPKSPSSLRSLAAQHGLHIGAAVSEHALREDPAYREILAREFNMITCENALKWGPLRPTRDQFAFENADLIVDFAEANDMVLRGHTLVWHNMLPAWLSEQRLGNDDAHDLVREHIQTVMRRYRGRIAVWDVVNEAIEDDGIRDSFFLHALGPDYLATVFHWAHEADPDARLFYNDYEADAINAKSDAIYALIKDLLQRGVPIHGVGLQMHLCLWAPPKAKSVAKNIRRFNDLGLEVHITEMDVRMKEPATEENLRAQARIYRDMIEVCLDAAQCTALVTWGVTDRYSWVPDAFQGEGAALLFDNDGLPKPAYHALRETLENPPKKSKTTAKRPWPRLFK